ncbi:hypothetical protein ACLKA6_010035 [Drosophila palustris]
MAGKFNEGDYVFAEKRGYLPWPGRLIDKSNCRRGIVQFIYTFDRHRIPYTKIWPYNEEYKIKFITKQALEYEEFLEAIRETESIINTKNIAPAPSEEELRFLHEVRQQRDSLNVEPLFIGEINKLRSNLTTRHQNYAIAQQAFEQLLKLPISQLLLVRSREAVESIRWLCHFVHWETENQAEVQLVRDKANELMERFAFVFRQPFSEPDFWSEFCKLSDLYMRYTTPKS